MTVETLNANGIASAGSWSGVIGDIDEPIASADAAVVSTTTDDDPIDLDLVNSAIEDGDTVNSVTIKVHCKRTAGDGVDQLLVDLLIGGTPQGTQQNTGALTASMATYILVDAVGWDTDWTAAQLDGMQARFTSATSGKPHSPAIQIDCIDVDVDYTEATSGRIMSSLAGAGGLAGPGGIAGQGGGLAG